MFLSRLNKQELQQLARDRELSDEGTNEELRARLQSWEQDRQNPSAGDKQDETGVRAGQKEGGASTVDAEIAQEEKMIRLLQLREQRAELEAKCRRVARDRQRGESTSELHAKHVPVDASDSDDDDSSSDEEVDLRAVLGDRERGRKKKQTRAGPYLVRDFVDRPEREEVIANGLGGRITVKGRAIEAEDIRPGDWIVGNSRVMLKLIQEGSLVKMGHDGRLDTKSLEAYLQYTISIGELMKRGFKQRQVILYDEDYRRFQFETQCKWGKSSLRLVTKHLVPTEPVRHSGSQNENRAAQQSNRQQARKAFKTPEGEEICIYFNRKGCTRRICNFKHVCSICYAEHSAAFHAGAKN
jgi:hypothetical protein